MSEIERIAAALTEAQRKYLMNYFSADWSESPPNYGNHLRGWASPKIGLLEGKTQRHPDLYLLRLTPLGLRLRAHLEQHHAKD